MRRPGGLSIPEEDLRCPATGVPLVRQDDWLATIDGSRRYPMVDGVPMLIAEERSLFSAQAFVPGGRSTTLANGSRRTDAYSLGRRVRRSLPSTSRNLAAQTNLARFADILEHGEASGARSRVLVVGGGAGGEGIQKLVGRPHVALIETDVFPAPRTQIVCDAHDLPFRDGCFDGVVCQAVLEHVLDPKRVVDEIHRVLKPEGIVYSEIPFMQQVHLGAYDFTRFTHLGHRRLFRLFDEIRSGACGGPGMALAWSARYFATSFVRRSRALRVAVDAGVSLLTFWLKYLDGFLARRPGGLDAASGTYFLGRRRARPVLDEEIVAAYRGGLPTPTL